MPKFIPYDYNQSSMVVVNYLDQLQPGTFEHAIHFLVDNKLDLSAFADTYNNDEGGRPAYDPAILLKVVLFAYSKGITSSREIEWCCQSNIIFKALSCDTVPHFTTIAAFVSSYPQAIEDVFEQVLLICDEQGLLGKELFAIDGCKLPSNAAKEWSGTFKELKHKRDKIKQQIRYHLKEHQRCDKSIALDEQRQQRHKQAVDTLEKAFDKVDHFLKSASPRMGQGRVKKEIKSNITDNESAKMTTSKGTIQGYNGIAAVDKKHQVIVDAQVFGASQEHHTLQPVIEAVKNRLDKRHDHSLTDTIFTADTGFACEANMAWLYQNQINAFVPDNRFRSRDPKFAGQKAKYGARHTQGWGNPKTTSNNLFRKTDFSFDPIAKSCTCPSGKTMWINHEGLDQQGNHKITFEGKITDCRHCEYKQHCMRNPQSTEKPKGHGRLVTFVLEKKSKANYTEWMKRRVDSSKGKQIYSHRMSVVEPVFGNIATNKGLNRFSLRGKPKVQAQWQLFCLVHNIEKLKNYGTLLN